MNKQPTIISTRRIRSRANPDHPLPITLELTPGEAEALCKAIQGEDAALWRHRIRYAVAAAEVARRVLRGEVSFTDCKAAHRCAELGNAEQE